MKTIQKAAILVVVIGLALFFFRDKDSRGSVVAHGISPEGLEVHVYERSPTWPAQSPYVYTFRISSREPARVVPPDWELNNDSARIDDFQIAFSGRGASVRWTEGREEIHTDISETKPTWKPSSVK